MRYRKLTLLVLLVLGAAISGCGSAEESPTATAEPPKAAEESPAATAVPPTVAPEPAAEVAWQADGVIGEGEYPHTVEAAGVTFYWANDGENLHAAMVAETGGWVSVGFDPESRMQGANYVFGYVQDGQTFVADMFGTRPAGPGSHPPDEELGGSNDVLEYAGREEGGVTVVEFKIPLDSGDVYDKPLSAGASYTIIVARGSRDDFDASHSARGSAEITLDQ